MRAGIGNLLVESSIDTTCNYVKSMKCTVFLFNSIDYETSNILPLCTARTTTLKRLPEKNVYGRYEKDLQTPKPVTTISWVAKL